MNNLTLANCEVKSLKEKSSCLITIFLITLCFPFVLINTVAGSFNERTAILTAPEQKQIDFSKIQIEVSSLGTFLRAEPNMNQGESIVQEPTIIDLEAEKISGSKWISISYSGEFLYSTRKKYSESEILLIGLFSTTSELKPIENLKRSPGAIDSGRDYKTGETYFSNLPTDISEDFIIMHPFENIIKTPRNAKFLFLCIADVYYPDNSGSIQVTIVKLEEYQVIFSIENILIMLEVAFITLVPLYYRRKQN